MATKKAPSILLAASPVSQLVGVVTYLTEVEMGRGDPEVFVAAARGPDMEALGYSTTASLVGSGAGLRWAHARGAALGECLERYAACAVEGDALIYGSYDALTLSGRTAHDPATWSLFHPSQQVPYPPFNKSLNIAWAEGWDLVTHESLWLPACFAYLSSSPVLSEFDAAVIGPSISTGCACASTAAEAALKGLYELIERDAFMIVWRNRLEIPEVTIDETSTIYDIYQSRFVRPGLEYRLWHTTLDFSVPSFLGVLFDHRGQEKRLIVGGAANKDAAQAVLKTLCELIQGLTWLEYINDHQMIDAASFEEIRTFSDRARLYASQRLPEAYSFLFRRGERVALSSIESVQAPVAQNLGELVAEVAGKGYRPAAIDLTTQDIAQCGYVVTRVVVPGFETMDGDHRLQMLGGKRWREIPVQLGLASMAPAIRNINPYPHPYP